MELKAVRKQRQVDFGEPRLARAVPCTVAAHSSAHSCTAFIHLLCKCSDDSVL